MHSLDHYHSPVPDPVFIHRTKVSYQYWKHKTSYRLSCLTSLQTEHGVDFDAYARQQPRGPDLEHGRIKATCTEFWILQAFKAGQICSQLGERVTLMLHTFPQVDIRE